MIYDDQVVISSKAKLGKRYNIIIIKLLNFYLIYPSKEYGGETTWGRNVRGETSSGGETTRGKRLGGGAKRLGEEMVLERNDSDSIEQACGGLSPQNSGSSSTSSVQTDRYLARYISWPAYGWKPTLNLAGLLQ